MDAERWSRIQQLFDGALQREPAERTAWLRGQEPDDGALVDTVLAMLDADAGARSLLDGDLATVAAAVLQGVVPVSARIGRYRITGVAGTGGMGVVYTAVREDLGSRAAIKVLRDAALSPMRRQRFADEQRVLAQLDHPFIAQLYDADVLPDGTPYFIMEFVDGLPLDEYARGRQLSMRERLLLFRDVCAGVQYAHAAAVLHRDLKPSNILVRDDGVVKLLDFGIARHLDEHGDAGPSTRTLFDLMTPAWTAPERITGGRIGTFTDVYSLGVVLYELLTDTTPFDRGATPGQLEAAILAGEIQPPSHRRPAGSLPSGPGRAGWADLDVLCMTAMHADPARRYGTVDALVADLDRFLAGRPLHARGDSRVYRLDRFVRRNARTVIAAGLATAVFLGMTGVYGVNLARARDNALVESARARQTQDFLLDLFDGDDPALGPTDSLRVVAILDRGVRDAALLNAEPRLQAALYATLGGAYEKLGRFSVADSLLHLALQRQRTLFGNGDPDAGATLLALGRLRAAEARVGEAEPLMREALDIATSTRREADQFAATLALGELIRDRGDYADARPWLERAVTMSHIVPPARALLALAALADNHFYLGEYEVADSLNRVVLARARALYGSTHPHVADALINLGAIQFEQGRYAAAETLYRQGLEAKLKAYGPEHHAIAAARTMLGRALVAQQRHDEALAELMPALVIKERVYGPVHPSVASTLNDIGIVQAAAADLDGAEASYRRMLSIYQQVYGGTHAFSGTALSNLANVYSDRGDHASAEQMLRAAVTQFEGAQGAEHTNTAIALIKLGRVVGIRGRPAEGIALVQRGYDTLLPQADPSSRFLQAARSYLVDLYTAAGDSAQAARWRAEHEQNAPPPQ